MGKPLQPLAALLLILLALLPPALQAHGDGSAHSHPDKPAAEAPNPRSDFWRKVREGMEGYTAVKGPETGVLIQGYGQTWRQLRNGPIAALGGGVLGLTVFALGTFYLWRGKLTLNHPRTGETVLRWTLGERVLHWYTATLFLWLALTGLSLLYGRVILIPLIGHEAFSVWANFSKVSHNFVGPPFIAGLLLMIASWARDNIPNRLDIKWFKAFGGMAGGRHPSAGRINAGEKAWFWLLTLGGVLISASGLALDFPNFGQERWLMQLSQLVHAVFALLLIAGALGHIYIGSIGTEGALEGMVSGRVDKSWAIQHHDLWYEEVKSADGESGQSHPQEANLAAQGRQ